MNIKLLKLPERTPKRRQLSKMELLHDLKSELPIIFHAFEKALILYHEEISFRKPQWRGRSYEATVLSSCINECMNEAFPDNTKFGKYKRFLLQLKGYTFLFKKFDRNGIPMNIKTANNAAIANQLRLPLFDGPNGAIENPILFFGYKKDKIGQIYDVNVSYIDEFKIRWKVTKNEVDELSTNLKPHVSSAKPSIKKRTYEDGLTGTHN